jgi:hypothetical protein
MHEIEIAVCPLPPCWLASPESAVDEEGNLLVGAWLHRDAGGGHSGTGRLTTRYTPDGELLSSELEGFNVAHLTLVENGAGQLAIGSSATGVVMRNNLVSHGTGWGMTANADSFAAFDHNLFYSHPSGRCSGCLGMYGAGSVLDMDPQLVNLLMRDLRLLPTSPARNAGADTGYDVNGATTGNGNFNGGAPDIGAYETP